MLDLHPATDVLSGLIRGVRDDQLTAPTPCEGRSLGALLDHVDGLALAFAAAAAKTPLDGGPSADASRLGLDWRQRIPERLDALALAWRDESAWQGVTRAGGIEMSGEEAGLVALDEVVIHAWDVAAASGQSFTCPPPLLEAVYQFVSAAVAENPNGTPGLFGPPVPVPASASLLDRLVGLTGRDPGWRPPQAGD
jgi:uncharacterized protein (TIGR03086 family)